jgi:hypothetical protein
MSFYLQTNFEFVMQITVTCASQLVQLELPYSVFQKVEIIWVPRRWEGSSALTDALS